MTVYCDHNAAAPLHAEALAAMLPWLSDGFANPSSIHAAGARARSAVEAARADVAALLGCKPAEVVFTSGGTESNDAALRGALRADPRGAVRRVVTTAIEHASVLATLGDLDDVEIDLLATDDQGRVDPEELQSKLDEPAALVSVGWANNEIGTIQPMEEIAEHCRAAGVRLHTDAVQAVGKIAIDVTATDLATVSAHKIGGPKGIGALYVRRGVTWEPTIRGGSQERSRRAGTENVAAIVGFACAARLSREQLGATHRRLCRLRDELWQRLHSDTSVVRHGPLGDDVLPNTLNVRFAGVRGEALVAALDLDGIAVSSGSACAAGAAEPSHVLIALGLDADTARDGVRFSFGAASSDDDPARIAMATLATVARIRAVRAVA